MRDQEPFPEIITDLPEADIPRGGLRAYLVQGESQQIVFMSYESDVSVPEHSHEAQWGVVLDGNIELTIDGKKYTFTRGDTFFIPKGIKHSGRIKAGYKQLTLYNQKDRFKAK